MANLCNSVGQVVLPVDGIRIPVDPLKGKPPGNGAKDFKGMNWENSLKWFEAQRLKLAPCEGVGWPTGAVVHLQQGCLTYLTLILQWEVEFKTWQIKKFKHVYAMWYISQAWGWYGWRQCARPRRPWGWCTCPPGWSRPPCQVWNISHIAKVGFEYLFERHFWILLGPHSSHHTLATGRQDASWAIQVLDPTLTNKWIVYISNCSSFFKGWTAEWLSLHVCLSPSSVIDISTDQKKVFSYYECFCN